MSSLLTSSESSRRRLRHIRSKHRPRDPLTLEKLKVSGQWATTMGEDPHPFLLYDNGTDADERLLIFYTEEHMQLLARSETLFMDGTFGVSPMLFAQLYVIHGRVGSCQCPLVYALMQRQTQKSYEELFNFILDRCSPQMSYINVDFEIAVHQAIRVVFGESVGIRGCFYHLTQSTWRKIQSLGLTDLYKSDETFRLYCGQMDALAFLPVDKVNEGMSYLRATMPPAAADLVDYFDSTYGRKCLACGGGVEGWANKG